MGLIIVGSEARSSEGGPEASGHPLVLIDDDDAIRHAWEVEARRSGWPLISCATPEEFWSIATTIAKEARIYVGRRLWGPLAGKLYANGAGFQHIWWRRDAVLIHRDYRLHDEWRSRGGIAGKAIEAVGNASGLSVLEDIPRHTPIYLDTDFGLSGPPWESKHWAAELHHRGFTELFIVTDKEQNVYAEAPWLKGIVGRSFPARSFTPAA